MDFEESDNSTEITESILSTTKFATNFGVEANIFKKIGLKFGASLENTSTSTVSRKYTLNSDYLGVAIVNFADKVIVGRGVLPFAGTVYTTREYDNGVFSISVEPKRVQ